MANIPVYQDLFPGSTSMRQAPGNGTISVPGAGDARLTAPNGANCQFLVTDSNGKAPILYDRLGSMWQLTQPNQAFFLETKLSYFTGTTNLRMAGLTIFNALPGTGVAFSSYQFGWYKNDGKIHVWYDYPSTEVEIVTAVTAADPVSTPHVYRIYWNNTFGSMYIGEVSLWLAPDTLCFAYSVNDGAAWASLGTRTRDFDLSSAYAGVYCRKWEISAVNAQADFAYFKSIQYNPVDQFRLPELGRDNQERLGLEDQGTLLNESGLPRFDLTDVLGAQEIKHPAPVALEDQVVLLSDGATPRFDLPEIASAVAFRSEGATLEEGLFVQLDSTDYIKGKFDPDGKELAGGTNIRHVYYYDASADPWHTHDAGYYGAGRDGKLYYDGVECGPGSFGTLTLGRRKTAWASNGDFVDVAVPGFGAGAYLTNPTITADDEIQCAVTPSLNGSGVSSRMRWYLDGDFDIQMDYEIVATGSGPTNGGITLLVAIDRNNYTYCRRRMWGNFYDKDVLNNGSSAGYVQVATTDTVGKLRITRSGANVASFYWTGSAWAQIGSTTAMTHTRPMYVDCFIVPQGGTVTATVKMRNFTINSGSTTNLIGWARESAGTYRGVRQDFPEHALLLSSGNSLDIIDVDSDKLWMSFRGGSNNVFGGDSNYFVRQAVMKDGVLFVSYRTSDSYGTADGHAAWIDFTLDFIRLVRGPTYNDAGLIYNVELSTNIWPRESTNGAIRGRNGGRAFMAAYSLNWRCQNMRVNWADLVHSGGYQYRLVANNGGVYLASWVRWRFEGVDNAHLNTPWYGVSTQTVPMYWAKIRPLSKDLLYHSRAKLWIVSYVTWEAVVSGGGGTWVEDAEYTLSGTRDNYDLAQLGQDSMALDDANNVVYYARNEGVYALNLVTGVSTLMYGKAGSGAAHEVLGSYASVTSVCLTIDGTVPLLLVGMARPDRVWAINRNTHTVYWKGFQDDAHQPIALAVGA